MSMPLDYFTHAAGPAAKPVMMLDWVFTGICAAVCVIVAALLVAALMRSREQQADFHYSPEALRWVYIGAGISGAVLLGMAVYMILVFHQILQPPQSPALEITVTGYQWWWRVDYGDFTTANEIHIPTGVPVLVHVKSADVIHTFWVPQLAGKSQIIPGIDNHQWIEADKPGLYRGQCSQLCGVQHAHMAFDVVAQAPADFKAWRAQQISAAARTAAGEKVFMRNCGGCHTIRGTAAAGKYAPDLTHLQSRRELAAGTMENTPQNLKEWVSRAQDLKPGSRMPNISLPPQEEAQLLTYLEGLK